MVFSCGFHAPPGSGLSPFEGAGWVCAPAVAIAALEKLRDEGYAIAAHQLGKCYRDGVGVQRDDAKAAEWFRRSAVQGNDCSEYALGKLLLELGKSAEGIDHLARAAEQDNQYAQYWLGKVYLMGEQVKEERVQQLR